MAPKLDLFLKPWHMQSSCCLYIWAYGQIYFKSTKKKNTSASRKNQRVITAFAGLKGMQSKNQSEIKVSGPKYGLQVPS